MEFWPTPTTMRDSWKKPISVFCLLAKAFSFQKLECTLALLYREKPTERAFLGTLISVPVTRDFGKMVY
jgi:hypothetical protein